MERRNPDGICWPNADQELVLKAALGDGAVAVDAWEAWQKTVEIAEVDTGSFRLLPLLYRNLISQGLDSSELGKLNGIYRQSWCRHQVGLRTLVEVLRALQGAGVETIVLKGAALAVLYYRDPGVRPMKDLDVLVPPARSAEAAETLQPHGWRPLAMVDPEAIAERHYSAPGGKELDIHHYLLPYDRYPGVDDDLWPTAVPLAIEGVASRALAPADQLFHVLVHGIAWNEVSQVRWVADAVTVIRAAGTRLDWSRVLEQTTRRAYVPAVRSGLDYLRRTFDVDIPADLVRELDALPVPRGYRLEHWARQRGPFTPLGWAPLIWCGYVRTLQGTGVAPGLTGYVRFLRKQLPARNPLSFGMLVAWKLLRILARQIARLVGSGGGAARTAPIAPHR
jgi:hypothetical protein